jgi:hypothetical protein
MQHRFAEHVYRRRPRVQEVTRHRQGEGGRGSSSRSGAGLPSSFVCSSQRRRPGVAGHGQGRGGDEIYVQCPMPAQSLHEKVFWTSGPRAAPCFRPRCATTEATEASKHAVGSPGDVNATILRRWEWLGTGCNRHPRQCLRDSFVTEAKGR